MNWINFLGYAVLLLLTLGLVLLFPFSIWKNLETGRAYRKKLALGLEKVRLGKMLKSLGLDTDRYLHQESVVDIHQQITKCSECKTTDQCDSHSQPTVTTIEYCPNQAALKALSATEAKTGT